MTAQELNAWLNFGGGQQLWEELSAKFNVIAFQSANTGVQMGGWFNKIKRWMTLKVTIRMPGLGAKSCLSAAAVALPGGEISVNEIGAIDASEWVGPWNDMAFGFTVAKYYCVRASASRVQAFQQALIWMFGTH